MPANINDQISLSSFRANISSIFKSVSQQGNTTIITKGDESAVLLSMADYKELCSVQETEYLMASPKNKERLLQSMQDVENGTGMIEVEI